MKIIAIEEHFYTPEYMQFLCLRRGYPRLEISEDAQQRRIERLCQSPTDYRMWNPEATRKLVNLGEERLREMDEAGIDMQVLSLSNPGCEAFAATEGKRIARKVNTELASFIKKYPTRFAGFAALAPQDPTAAAAELERTVIELGFKGANINSHIRGEYLDDPKFWVIFEKAEKLGVPIYLHPREPSPGMVKPFSAYPALTGSMWGFAAETGLHAMRLICSGVFDHYPGLKIVLGHLGEALPFWLWRIDERWEKGGAASDPFVNKLKKRPSQYVKDNFLVTISGMLWQPALICTHLALGPESILFAVDYPYGSNHDVLQFMRRAPISEADKEKIYHLNAEKLLKI